MTQIENSPPDLDKAPKPDPFRLRAQLVDEGSKSWLLGETENMQIKIRVYSPNGGENTMHAHHNQDHSFVILQGTARFYGAQGDTWDLGRNEGLMLPDGAYYCFKNSGEEPLVVLRIAANMPHKGDPQKRLGIQGNQIDPHTPENKRPEKIVYREGEFYE
jgi:mannose-6-phosphate isomerase-like protein (cupin superfamily)